MEYLIVATTRSAWLSVISQQYSEYCKFTRQSTFYANNVTYLVLSAIYRWCWLYFKTLNLNVNEIYWGRLKWFVFRYSPIARVSLKSVVAFWVEVRAQLNAVVYVSLLYRLRVFYRCPFNRWRYKGNTSFTKNNSQNLKWHTSPSTRLKTLGIAHL